MAENTIKLTIDGKEAAAPKGMNLIEAAKLVAVEVPHYCYHPKLTIAGNCRMCLVDIGMPKLGADKKPEIGPDGKPVILFGPKLAIGCNTTVAEGMVVHTRSGKVIKAREGVMEFLLVNHPLDCPICYQAGECRLQEFSVDYGKGQSRFIEEKVHKPKKTEIGPKIMLDDERCILCSRCVRFMKEVAGQDCLGFVERGSYSTLTCYPGMEPNTNYDLNIVDICPVGALTSNDFRFKQRVWFLKETKSVCPNCATGCNTVLASGERFNLTWPEATRQIGEKLKALKGKGATIAAIGTARATTEELFLFNKLVREVLGAELVDCVPHVGEGDKFLISSDRNPNTNGAKLAGVTSDPVGGRIPVIAEAIKAGKIKTLIVHGENVAKHEIG